MLLGLALWILTGFLYFSEYFRIFRKSVCGRLNVFYFGIEWNKYLIDIVKNPLCTILRLHSS
jgi:hypothetical protein